MSGSCIAASWSLHHISHCWYSHVRLF